MRLFALIVALVISTLPTVAQDVTQADNGVTEGQSHPGPPTDVICREEVSATFCNVVVSPSNGGFGATNGAQGTAGSSAVPTPIPHCGDFWPAAEQCD